MKDRILQFFLYCFLYFPYKQNGNLIFIKKQISKEWSIG